MKKHRHLNIITRIADNISSAGCTVHLWKVRSHIGIVGNEIADDIAVGMSTGKIDHQAADTERYDTPSNNRNNMYWVYTEQEIVPKENEPPENKNEPQTAYVPMANMTEALKDHVHRLRKLGNSNQETIYFGAWQSAEKKLDPEHSHAFMTSSLVSGYQRKLALQYRFGLLPSQKLMHRYKKAETDRCPLCGDPDGGHHAVSGCRQLSKATTLRHNEAGTAIVEAIYHGSKGNQLIASDVGANKRREEKGRPKIIMGRTISAAALPPAIPTRVRQHLMEDSIPDAVLYHYDRKKRRRCYTIVEIKYSRDTDPEAQIARAEAQHAQLADTIKTYDPTAQVQRCNLMLGVSGAIYRSTVQHLQTDLGIDGPELKALLKKLHLIAIAHLERIWKYRRAKINEQFGRTASTKRHAPDRNPRKGNRHTKPARPK